MKPFGLLRTHTLIKRFTIAEDQYDKHEVYLPGIGISDRRSKKQD